MRRTLVFPALLTLAACGASPTRPTTAPVTPPAAPASLQPCPLAEGRWVLDVPVPDGHALAATEGACLLVDERREATFLSLATLATNAEGAELLERDPDAFFRASGLLGEAPQRAGEGELIVLEARRPATRWVAALEGLGTRAVWTTAARRGETWLVALLVGPPEGDLGELAALLAHVRPRVLEFDGTSDD